MLKFSTADRLKQLMNLRELRQIDIVRLCEPYCKMYKVKLGRNAISQYVAGKVEPRQNALYILGQALNVSEAWLMGCDVPMERVTPEAEQKAEEHILESQKEILSLTEELSEEDIKKVIDYAELLIKARKQ